METASKAVYKFGKINLLLYQFEKMFLCVPVYRDSRDLSQQNIELRTIIQRIMKHLLINTLWHLYNSYTKKEKEYTSFYT